MTGILPSTGPGGGEDAPLNARILSARARFSGALTISANNSRPSVLSPYDVYRTRSDAAASCRA